MLQVKGTGKSGLVIPELNVKSCTESQWMDSNVGGPWQQRSTKHDRRTFICGGWFHPSLTETKVCGIAVEDYDQNSASGYSSARFTAQPIGGNAGYARVLFENYRSGGSDAGHVDLPSSDPDQWFHYMTSWSGTMDTMEWWVNGKYCGEVKYHDPPYITSQNRNNSSWCNTLMSRRYAGAWYRAQTYSGAIYNYFLMDLEAFKGTADFLNAGMVPNDRDTYYKPWMEMDSEFVVPITDKSWPSRATTISNTDRGLYVTVEQSKNDIKGYYDASTYTDTRYDKGSESTYQKQLVYGYTL